MKEIKNPKKNLLYYYAVAILIVVLLNSLILPMINKKAIKEVDYGTFMTMTEVHNIQEVEIQTNQIIFTDKSAVSIDDVAEIDCEVLKAYNLTW